MIRSGLLERALWAATVVIASLGALGTMRAVPTGWPALPALPWRAPAPAEPLPPDTVAAAADAIAANDPFRLDHRPSTVAYRVELEGVAPPPPPP
ncbi:MAG: hypothetical protein IRY91_10430, partial [Gemmatimonadaceae bacterium]|nr:hypothetical protein [Gemmatimonadaceae bacterium]